MKKLSAPITQASTAEDIAHLHEAVAALVARGATPDVADVALTLARERSSGRYGDALRRVISLLQQEIGIDATGEVDAATAAALNRLLGEAGLLDAAAGEVLDAAPVAVAIRVEDGAGRPVAGVSVALVHSAAGGAPLPLGRPGTTDATGAVTLIFRRSDYATQRGEGGPSLGFRVGRNETPLGYRIDGARDGVLSDFAPRRAPVVLTLTETAMLGGRVTTASGQLIDGATLRLYRRDFGGGESRLAESLTARDGRYILRYDAGPGDPILEIRAVGEDGEITLSRPLSGLSDRDRLQVDLVAPDGLQKVAAEFQRLTGDADKATGRNRALGEASEAKDRQDITILARLTGWDARLLATAARAERLAARGDMPLGAEALYGLLRCGLPARPEALARIRSGVVAATLDTARAAGVIEMTEAERDAAVEGHAAFARAARLAETAPGARSTYDQLLESTGLAQASRDRFADVVLSGRRGADLWAAAADAGLPQNEIALLRRHGRLASLAGYSAPLTSHLMKELPDGPAAAVARGLYDAGAWRREILAAAGVAANDSDNPSPAQLDQADALVPPVYIGAAAADRIGAYAEDMARKVRLAYPTQSFAHRIETDPRYVTRAAAAPATARLMSAAAAQGFRLGATPVTTFLRDRPGLTAGLAEADYHGAADEMKTMQRLYQVTTEDDAVPVLQAMGMTSSQDIVAMRIEAFEVAYTRHYRNVYQVDPPSGQPRMVHRKAQQVSSMVYSLFSTAAKLQSEPAIPSLGGNPSTATAARAALVRHLPTLESLFGSMEIGACDHCNSVLGPAAYLVDILQLLDVEPQVWANYVAQWEARTGAPYPHRRPDGGTLTPYDALVARRPDLPHLPLTCDNTTTVLPYIDVVNEILEYHVANGALAAGAVRDTGEAESADLLAEPQNVIREAYEALRSARYPLGLPFDQPLEMARALCDGRDLPLAEILDAFRPSEALFDPAAGYDRAAVFLEELGLSQAETRIFTDPDPLARWWELYGYANAGAALTVATDPATGQRVDLNSAKALARRLGVSYREIAELVQTGFVNPDLGQLAILYKLGLSIGDARTYVQHQALLGANPAGLSQADRSLQRDLQAIDQRLVDLAGRFGTDPADLRAAVQAIPFGRVLVLADTDTGGSFGKTLLRFADATAARPLDFLRLNLFVRLWRKLGWSIAETDRALTTFLPAAAPYDAAHFAQRPLHGVLVQIAHLKAIETRLKPGREGRLPLLAFWRDISTSGPASPYARLLLSRQVLAADPVFDDPLGAYLSPAAVSAHGLRKTFHTEARQVQQADSLNPADFAGAPRVTVGYDAAAQVQSLSIRGPLGNAERAALAALSASPVLPGLLDAVQAAGLAHGFVAGHALALQGALGLTAEEMSAVLAEAGQTPADAPMSLATVSHLYRHALLARLMRLPVAEVIALKQLSGIDPFRPLAAAPIAMLADDRPFSATLAFIEMADRLKEAELKPLWIDWLLRHRQTPEAAQAEAAASDQLLRGLAAQLMAINAAHATPADAAMLSDEVLRDKLGLVLEPEVAARLLAYLAGSVDVTVSQAIPAAAAIDPADLPAGTAVVRTHYDAAQGQQSLTLRGVFSDAGRDALAAEVRAALPAGAQPTLTALVIAANDAARAEAQAFFTTHLVADGVTRGFLQAGDFALIMQRADPGLAAAALEARDRQRRTAIASGFLPYLRRRLGEEAIIAALSAATGAAPDLARALLNEPMLLASEPGLPLVTTLAGAASSGLTLTVDGAPGQRVPGGDSGATDGQGARLRPAGDALTIEGVFEVPASGPWRFEVDCDRAGTMVELSLSGRADPQILAGAAAADGATVAPAAGVSVNLEAGTRYQLRLRLDNLAGGEARLTVQGEALTRGPVERLLLTPAADAARARRASALFGKVATVAATLSLDIRDLRHMLSHPGDFGGFTLNDLPDAPTGDNAASRAAAQLRFGHLRTLADYAVLKRDLAQGGDALIQVFEASRSAAADRLDRLVYPLIARLTGRSAEIVGATARTLATNPDFRSTAPIARLARALAIAGRLGAGPTDIRAWTGLVAPAGRAPAQRHELARGLREAMRARLDEEGWRRFARPIFDRLRQRQRDALVGQVMQTRGFSRVEEMFAHFLIDPGMEPPVQTSRIRLAIGSVQAFIRQILLNLVPEVPPSAINADHWEWMKIYRVWEANRKIFLFPENWLEPEFREDKSPFFSELEGALLQDDVSADVVEDAFLTYLRRLDTVARLDVVAMHLQDSPDPSARVLHVIARSHSEPYAYYYRRMAGEVWSGWETVDVEIAGDHLAPVWWRDRLYLFWVTFGDHADADSGPETPANGAKTLAEVKVGEVLSDVISSARARKRVDVTLHWAEYSQGSWTTQEGGGPGTMMTRSVSSSFTPRRAQVFVTREPLDDDGAGGVFINIASDIQASFYLAGRNSPVEEAGLQPFLPVLYGASGITPTGHSGSGPFEVYVVDRRIEDGVLTQIQTREVVLSGAISGYRLTPLNAAVEPWGASAEAAAGAGNAVAQAIAAGIGEIMLMSRPFFYSDNRHTFFVRPAVTETTVEEWEDWVTDVHQPGLNVGDGVDHIAPGIRPRIPDDLIDIEVIEDIRGPRPFSVLGGLVEPPAEDWLSNPLTAVEFDGVLLGPQGQLGAGVAMTGAARGGMAPVLEVTGSTAPGISGAVLGPLAGLEAGSGGIMVVGTAGYAPQFGANLAESAAGMRAPGGRR
jgi:hypothetical protein